MQVQFRAALDAAPNFEKLSDGSSLSHREGHLVPFSYCFSLWTPTKVKVSYDYSRKRLAPAPNESLNKPCSNNAQQASNVTRCPLSPNLPQYHDHLTKARPTQVVALKHIAESTLEQPMIFRAC